MRKPKIIIFDDDTVILEMISDYFSLRNFEVQSFSKPVLCSPSSDADSCVNPCADILIVDLRMPRINGIQLITHQVRNGCPINIKNKAIMSGDLPYEHVDKIIELAGIFFQKPLNMRELDAWAKECISRIDLSQPLGMQASLP